MTQRLRVDIPKFSEELQRQYFEYQERPEKDAKEFENAYVKYKIEQIQNLFSQVEFPPEDTYKLDKSHPNYPKILEILKKEPENEFGEFPLNKLKIDLELKIKFGLKYFGQVNSDGKPHGIGLYLYR